MSWQSVEWCGICLEHAKVRGLMRGCSAHFFCYDCLVQWLHRVPSCPTCRADVSHYAAAADLADGTKARDDRWNDATQVRAPRTFPPWTRTAFAALGISFPGAIVLQPPQPTTIAEIYGGRSTHLDHTLALARDMGAVHQPASVSYPTFFRADDGVDGGIPHTLIASTLQFMSATF